MIVLAPSLAKSHVREEPAWCYRRILPTLTKEFWLYDGLMRIDSRVGSRGPQLRFLTISSLHFVSFAYLITGEWPEEMSST